YFLAGDESRCRPTHIAGLQSVLRRPGQVNLNLALGLIERDIDVIVDDALDSGELVLQLEALTPQDGQVLAVQADDYRLFRSGENLFDALVEIGEHIAIDARVAVDNATNRLDRLVVVRLLVDADPVFGEVHPSDLFTEERLANVRAERSDTRDSPQVVTDACRYSRCLLRRRARGGDEMDQEVAFLE